MPPGVDFQASRDADTTRALQEVGLAIAAEEVLLATIKALFEAGTPPSRWPAEARASLSLALFPPDLDDVEAHKAWSLGVHLFGPPGSEDPGVLAALGAPPAPPTALEQRLAERLRADLKRQVALRRGRRWLDALASDERPADGP